MRLPRIARPLLALALLAGTTTAPAWDVRANVIAPTAWFGFSLGTPVIHRHAYHYPPRWPAYAPYHRYGGYGAYGRGYYQPRHGFGWRGYDRHRPRRWAGQHHFRGGRHDHRDHHGHRRDRWRR